MWIKLVPTTLVVFLVCLTASISLAADDEVLGVFGIGDYGEDTALALWVPLESTASVTGIRWYNNDSQACFSEVLAVAGVLGELSSLNDAISIGVDVSGVNSGWSEFSFDQPLASTTDGFYLYFRMPQSSPFNHIGAAGGAGIGYQIGDGTPRSWLTGDGENWDPIAPEYMMAVEPIVPMAKSAQTSQVVLVLGADRDQDADTVEIAPPVTNQRSLQVFPNPFNPKTEIKFSLMSSTMVELTVFDIRGRTVRHLLREDRSPGDHVVTWDGRSDSGESVPSGVYLARVKSREGISTARMTLVQ